MKNIFKEEWDKRKDYKLPEKLRNVIEISFDQFQEKVNSNDKEFAELITESLLQGDAYLIKNTFKTDYLKELKEKTFEWGQKEASSFHKCLEGTPNFNRRVDKSLEGRYNSKSIWHQHLFYRWNGDIFGLFEPIYDRWRVMKKMWGLDPHAYENNTPKDGIVDRIHIYKFPKGGGYLDTHADPYLFQKTIMVVKMTEKGKDYNKGGLYFIDQNDNKVEVEDKIDLGDMYFAFPTVLHGVDAIDPEEEVNWNSIEGRWILGFYSMNSDHVEFRHTVNTIGGY
jgi:hypothetical protein